VRGQGSDSFREATLTQRMGTLTDVVQLAERHESGMRDIAHGRHASKPKVRFDSPVERDRREAPRVRAQGERGGDAAVTYTAGQMESILHLMAITNGAPPKQEMPSWKNRGNSPSPYKRESERRGRSPSPSPYGQGRNPSRSPGREPAGIKCFKCQGIGHMARECPSPGDFVWKDGKGQRVERDHKSRSPNPQGVPAGPAATPKSG